MVTIDILGDICLAWYFLCESDSIKVADEINVALGKVDYRIANLEALILCRESVQPSLIEGEASNIGINIKYINFLTGWILMHIP